MMLYAYISFKKVEAQWGDGMVGLTYERARSSLQGLEKLNVDKATHTKNWRPQILLMCKVDVSDESLRMTRPKSVTLLNQLKGGRGLSILGCVIQGRLAENADLRKRAEASLRTQRDTLKLRGFVQAIMNADVDHGLTSLIQTAGLGGLAPNTVMANWPSKEPNFATARRLTKLFNEAHAYNLALIVCKGSENVPEEPMRKPIDIWWVVHDGGFQLLLSTILRKSRVWADAPLRVFCVLQAGENPDELQDKVIDFLYKMRIDAVVKAVVITGTSADANALNRHRTGGADSAWAMNAAIVSQPIGDLLQGTAVTDDNIEESRMSSRGPDDAAGARPVSPDAVRKGGSFSIKRANSSGLSARPDQKHNPMKKRTSVVAMDEMKNMSVADDLALKELNMTEELANSWRETFAATKLLNSLFLKYSAGSALLITNLPMPGTDPTSPKPYTMQVKMLTEAVPLCLLVAGQAKSDVVTMFS